MSFHTGLTPTEETFHTGLTPTDGEFHTGLTHIQESVEADAIPSSVMPSDLSTSEFDFSNSLFPFSDGPLTIPTDAKIQERARSNSIDIDESLDASLVAMPSFLEELQTYGQMIGPSQGLHSDNFLPARPLSLLTAPGPIPGAPYSNMQPTSAAPPFSAIQPFSAVDTFASNPFRQSAYDAFAQPMSVVAATYKNHMVSDPFAAANAFGVPVYSDPLISGFDFATMQQQPLSAYDPFPQMQFAEQPRKISDATDGSSRSPPPGVEKKIVPTGQPKFLAELPEKPADKPWVRVNATTKGKTSRTGKINHYDPSQYYSKIPHPFGSVWSTDRGKEFRYNQWHELTKNDLTASQVKDFIYQHPKNKNGKLTLFIQRAPADSKRRYPTSTLDKCRFKDCPMRLHGNKGSFLHGHYRVAFDELSYKYGKGEHNDPFQVAAYVHLYCLERFLDLPEICRLSHVRVEADGRQIAKEPNGNFAPALGGSECRVAVNFIDAARKGRIQDDLTWSQYPDNMEYQISVNGNASRHVAFNLHRHTLNYALQMCKNAGRGGRVMSRMKPSNVAVHRGDLEMYCLGRKNLLSDDEVTRIEDELQQIDANQAPAVSTQGGRKRRASSFGSDLNKKVRFA